MMGRMKDGGKDEGGRMKDEKRKGPDMGLSKGMIGRGIWV
jgi:hypothetical protein